MFYFWIDGHEMRVIEADGVSRLFFFSIEYGCRIGTSGPTMWRMFAILSLYGAILHIEFSTVGVGVQIRSKVPMD